MASWRVFTTQMHKEHVNEEAIQHALGAERQGITIKLNRYNRNCVRAADTIKE
jgi:hypothetical protein